MSAANRRRMERAARAITLSPPQPASASDSSYIFRFNHGGIDFVQWILRDGIDQISNDAELRSLYHEYEKERMSNGESQTPGMRGAAEVLAEVRQRNGARRAHQGFGLPVHICAPMATCSLSAYHLGGIHFYQWLQRGGLRQLSDDQEMIAMYRIYEAERLSRGEIGNGRMRGAAGVLEGVRREREQREEREQYTKEMEAEAYEKASQIPAHMAIAVIRELENLSSEEMCATLKQYLSHLCNNTYSLEPHPIVFPGGIYQETYTGNIAVDLEKHLEDVHEIVRTTHDCKQILADRVEMLREALRQNGADGEEYERIAFQLRAILLTSQYTRRGREVSGNWDLQYVGFMEADPLRDYVTPPRVAAVHPTRECLFAPTPEGCTAQGRRH